MKALYTNEKEYQIKEVEELKSYDYNSRYQALKDGYKFVHLFQTSINESDEKTYQYYSTMNL